MFLYQSVKPLTSTLRMLKCIFTLWVYILLLVAIGMRVISPSKHYKMQYPCYVVQTGPKTVHGLCFSLLNLVVFPNLIFFIIVYFIMLGNAHRHLNRNYSNTHSCVLLHCWCAVQSGCWADVETQMGWVMDSPLFQLTYKLKSRVLKSVFVIGVCVVCPCPCIAYTKQHVMYTVAAPQ